MILPFITTGHTGIGNPGDVFIGLGAQYLVENAVGPVMWQHLSRFAGKSHWDRYEDILDENKVVIYGGMPQYNNFDDWHMWYDNEMWNDVIIPKGYRVLSLAGGAGYPSLEMTPDELADHCMSSEKTVEWLTKRKEALVLCTTRDKYANVLLNRLGIENHYLACSATFAFRHVPLRSVERDLCVIVPPSTTNLPGPYREAANPKKYIKGYCKRWKDLYLGLKEQYGKVLLVCHGWHEYDILRNVFAKGEIFYTQDYIVLMNIYNRAHTAVSARLHGVLPAFGTGEVKCVSIPIDTRGFATEVFKEIPTILYPDVSLESVTEALTRAEMAPIDKLDEYVATYKRLIRKSLETTGVLDKLGGI
jgi:hypothetical protein